MTDEVLRDLVDAVLQEGLVAVEPPEADGGWGRVGTLRVRLHGGGALQRFRAVPGAPVLDDRGAPVTPADAVAGLGLHGPGAADLTADLTSAAEHAAVLGDVERSAGLLGGERRMAARGRPFHPTARAVSGWTADDVRTFGPTRAAPLACAWVAVARDRLRLGPDPASADLAAEILDDDDRERLAATGFDHRTHQPLPVHPWQHEHVLPREFAPEIAAGLVVPLDAELGRFHPTASWRTLALADDPRRHLKLPLGAATLGTARLLPPRHLDHGDRAQRLLQHAAGDDVEVCDESTWAGWGGNEFEDRPGHLAAQLRRYPDDLDGFTLPLGALAAHTWDELGPQLGVHDPLAFFGGLADVFTTMVVGFLARGVLPEVHGQNVVVRLAPGGAVLGFVLRDHDTVRIHRPWLATAGLADPGYRTRPGARQTLYLDTPDELVGYAQTLGFQVALYGVADALARHHGLPERPFWDRLREAVERAPDLRPEVAHLLLDAPSWPTRTLVGPLLARGRSGSVSMPAGTGRVPNPLRGGEEATPDDRARAATVTRLVRCVLREIGPLPSGAGPVRLHDPVTGRSPEVTIRHHSPSGHHVLDPVADHDEAVAVLLGIVAAAVPDEAVELLPTRIAALTDEIADSTARTARHLAARPATGDPTRRAEQSVRHGHPFHPTPKSTLDERWAPELGAAFRLPHLALDPRLVVERLDGDGPWLPDDATASSGWPVLPVHPAQLAHLRSRPETARMLVEGTLVELGARGGEVYPTSSVRTVCDPGFPTMWKLPLHVRITNFVRTLPPEHVARAMDASRVVAALRKGWDHPGFGVWIETGFRGADPALVGDDVAADLAVVFREHPLDESAPRVLAALVEEGPRGEEPPLVGEMRASGLDPAEWLQDYLRVSLLPMLEIFARDGVGFEAHLQNTLLVTECGRPVGFRVRDMEGTHVRRDRLPAGLDARSPLIHDEADAWQRFRYHGVVNQLAGVVAVLGRHVGDEAALWAVVGTALRDLDGGPAAPWADDLRTSPTLPAKANLLSRLGERGETPLFVDLPNPMRG